MNIVLVTGELAYNMVRDIVTKYVSNKPGVNIIVLKLPISVAAMMNKEFLEKELPRHDRTLREADLVIVPGYASGDLTELSGLIGRPVLKGVRYASDIPLMIDAVLSGVQLSPITPADELIKQHLVKLEKEVLENARQKAFLDNYFLIGDENKVPISKYYPIVLAEIYIDRNQRHVSIRNDILRYADVLVIGLPYDFPHDKAREVVILLKGLGKPVGIDTPDLELLKELHQYVDLVMSVSSDNISEVIDISGIRDKPVVITPSNIEHGVEDLIKGVQRAREAGFSKIIADPVLNPPLLGLVNALERYLKLRLLLPDVPLLMGVGNVTELMDADSIGINALLASMGVEIGIELYLTTEASVKTRGCVKELRKALDMMIISKNIGRPPKDLSANLLVIKDKRLRGHGPSGAPLVIEANERLWNRIDPHGYVKIYVDHDTGRIILEHFPLGSSRPDIDIIGKDPYVILKEIVKRELISLPEHYFYIGIELCKAYIALRTGKEYVQDEDMF